MYDTTLSEGKIYIRKRKLITLRTIIMTLIGVRRRIVVVITIIIDVTYVYSNYSARAPNRCDPTTTRNYRLLTTFARNGEPKEERGTHIWVGTCVKEVRVPDMSRVVIITKQTQTPLP